MLNNNQLFSFELESHLHAIVVACEGTHCAESLELRRDGIEEGEKLSAVEAERHLVATDCYIGFDGLSCRSGDRDGLVFIVEDVSALSLC